MGGNDPVALLASIGMDDAAAYLQQARKQNADWLRAARRQYQKGHEVCATPEPEPELEPPSALGLDPACSPWRSQAHPNQTAEASAKQRADASAERRRERQQHAQTSSLMSSSAAAVPSKASSASSSRAASPSEACGTVSADDWAVRQAALERRIAHLELELRLVALERQSDKTRRHRPDLAGVPLEQDSFGSSVRSEPHTSPSEPCSSLSDAHSFAKPAGEDHWSRQAALVRAQPPPVPPQSVTVRNEEEEAIQRALAGVAAFMAEDDIAKTQQLSSSSAVADADSEVARALRNVASFMNDGSAAAHVGSVSSTAGQEGAQTGQRQRGLGDSQLAQIQQELRERREQDDSRLAQIQRELLERQHGQSQLQSPLIAQSQDPHLHPSAVASRWYSADGDAMLDQSGRAKKSAVAQPHEPAASNSSASGAHELHQQAFLGSSVKFSDDPGQAQQLETRLSSSVTGEGPAAASADSPSPLGTLRTMSEVESDLEISRATFRAHSWRIEDAEREAMGLDNGANALIPSRANAPHAHTKSLSARSDG